MGGRQWLLSPSFFGRLSRKSHSNLTQTDKTTQADWRGRWQFYFVAALALLLLADIGANLSLRQYEQAQEERQRTRQILISLSELRQAATDAETALRGYVITGQEEYLPPHAEAEKSWQARFAELRALTPDDPWWQQQLNLLERLLKERLELAGQGVATRRERGFEAARDFVLAGRGKQIMDQIRQLCGRLETSERTKLIQREETITRNRRATHLISILSGILAIALVTAAVLFQRRESRRRQFAERDKALIFELTPDLLCVADFEGRFKQLNPAWEKTLGWLRAEMLGQPFLDFVHPEDVEATRQAAGALAEDRPAISFRNRYRCQDGSYKWLSWNSSPLPNEKLIFAAARDVTALVETELALQKAHDELETKVRQRTAELSRANRALRMLTNCNQILVRSQSEPELLPQVCEAIVRDGDFLGALVAFAEPGATKAVRIAAYSGFDEAFVSQLQLTSADTDRGRGPTGTAIRTGKPAVFQDITSSPELEPWRAMALERGIRSVIGLPLKADEQVLGALTVDSSRPDDFDDVEVKLLQELADDLARHLQSLRTAAAHQQTEAALHSAEERYRLLVEGVREYAIVLLGPSGEVMTWNSGAERQTGYQAAEILGQSFARFFTPAAAAQGEPEKELETAKLEGVYQGEGWRQRKDGSIYLVRSVLTALRDAQGGLRGFAKISQDITERKKLEDQLQQLNNELEDRVKERTAQLAEANQALRQAKEEADKANQAKSDFLSRMSHELRTPMNAVLGFAQLMEMDGLPSPTQEHVQQILKAGRHLLELINEVLDIARIDAGRLSLSPEPVLVREIVQETMDLIHPLAEERQVRLKSALDEELLEHHLMVDRQRFKQVMLNLLVNAVK